MPSESNRQPQHGRTRRGATEVFLLERGDIENIIYFFTDWKYPRRSYAYSPMHQSFLTLRKLCILVVKNEASEANRLILPFATPKSLLSNLKRDTYLHLSAVMAVKVNVKIMWHHPRKTFRMVLHHWKILSLQVLQDHVLLYRIKKKIKWKIKSNTEQFKNVSNSSKGIFILVKLEF